MGIRMNDEAYIDELLYQLTLEEKIDMIHGAAFFHTKGVERLEIPALMTSDGPMGVRAEFYDDKWVNIGTTDDLVTYLPCNSAVASSWNRELARAFGEVLGEETRGRGKDVILAPGINIKRSPLCGRNFEYMSEDPYLVAEMVAPLIQGIQNHDVAACVKHFAVNEQETERLWVDTLVDERTLQEIYFPGFRSAVEKGGVFTLMGAYNRLNGEHCCTSKSLLNQVLREEWKFDGAIISDWGGVHDTTLAAESELDLEMDVTPNFDEYFMANPLLKKVQKGEIPEALIDKKIRNLLRLMLRIKMIGPNRDARKSGTYNTVEHRNTALEIARESVVLLKNEGQVLPLSDTIKKVAVIGYNASRIHSNGGGSSEIKALYEISPLMGIKKLLGGNVKVSYAPGYVVSEKEEEQAINWQADSTRFLGPKEEEVKSAESIEDKKARFLQEALELAKDADQVIFVGGLSHDFDTEGADRRDMKLPYEQDIVIEKLLSVNPNTVVVMYAGSPVEMPWLDSAKAVVWSYYSGMEGGTALAEVLYGKVNPSGKLAETMPRSLEQCSAHSIGTFGNKDVVELKEGVMVGYRHYNTKKMDVLFPFGHGLSYSSFTYANGSAESCGEKEWKVSFDVTNESDREGKEIVQLYVAPKTPSVERPVQELKAFDKVLLQPKETKRVTLTLDAKAFSYYDVERKAFVVDAGNYELQVAASSRDIRLKMEIVVG